MTQIYPKEIDPTPPSKLVRRWHVYYNLAYDGGGSKWTGYYRTYIGARIAAWYNYHFASYGGSVILKDTTK